MFQAVCGLSLCSKEEQKPPKNHQTLNFALNRCCKADIFMCPSYAQKSSYLDTAIMPHQTTRGKGSIQHVRTGSTVSICEKIAVTFQLPGGKNQLPFLNSFCRVKLRNSLSCHTSRKNRLRWLEAALYAYGVHVMPVSDRSRCLICCWLSA